MVSSGKVTFRAGEIAVTCNLTFTGTLNSSIPNLERPEERQSLGSIKGVTWRECAGGEIETVLGLPWNILYTGETGPMPNEVRSLQFSFQNAQAKFSILGGFVGCLYARELPFSMAMVGTRTAGVYTSGPIRTEAPLNAVSGLGCPSSLTMIGTFNMSPTQTMTIS